MYFVIAIQKEIDTWLIVQRCDSLERAARSVENVRAAGNTAAVFKVTEKKYKKVNI